MDPRLRDDAIVYGSQGETVASYLRMYRSGLPRHAWATVAGTDVGTTVVAHLTREEARRAGRTVRTWPGATVRIVRL